MWSLFPQTSSSNLNNNLYLPSSEAASGIRGPGSGRGGKHAPAGVPAAPGPWVHLGPPRAPALPQPPEARRGSPGGETGAGQGDGRGLDPSLPPGSRACPPQPRCTAAPVPRVTSGQIQRDVLLAAVIPPCAKQTHNPS